MTADPQLFQDDRMPGHAALPPREQLDSWFIKDAEAKLAAQIREVIGGWSDGCFVDPIGNVWVDSDFLYPIVRVASLVDLTRFHPRKVDSLMLNENTYFRGARIGRVIDSVIEKVDKDNTNRCAEVSKELFLLIRDSKTARQRQKQYYDNFDDVRKRLRKMRLRKFRITEDELTGEKLDPRTAEFTYVREPAFYRELTQDIDNGLVVNSDTYETLLKSTATDEKELYRLCDRNDWNKEWYKNIPYSRSLLDTE